MKSKPIYSLVFESKEPFGRQIVEHSLTFEKATATATSENKGNDGPYHVVPMRKCNNWKPVLRSLAKILKEDGYELDSVNDGEGDAKVDNDVEKAVAMMDGVDESYLYFRKPGMKLLFIWVVLGNSPEETVADCSVNDALDATLDRFSKKWEGRDCPVRYEADKWGK
jgi:hypothetical protein